MICGNRARFFCLISPRAIAEFDQRAHAGEAARHHFAVVEVGDRRKSRTFGDDQAHDVAAPRRRHLLDEGSGKPLHHVAHRCADGRRRVQPADDQRHDGGADQLLEHRFLVLEVQIDRALGDAGAFGDVVEPRRRKPARDELVHRRLDDRPAPLGRALGAVGCRRRRGRPVQPSPRPAIGGFRGGFPGRFWCVILSSLYMTDWSVIVNLAPMATSFHIAVI